MKSRNTLFSLVLALAVFLAACGGAATPEAMMEKSEDAMMDDEMPASDEMTEEMTDEMADEPADMMEVPTWFSAALTNVLSDQTFTINDFKGKVVLVETMAIWCSNCLKQQTQVKALHEALGMRDDFVSIGLDIDPNENVDALKGFVENQGFDWYYAVSPADVSREIASLYGDQFLNPPSTPIVVIDRHGKAHTLPFGIKSADDLRQAIQPFLDESM